MEKESKHFEGKSAVEHLQEARLKGLMTTAELHGLEPSGSTISFLDNMKTSTTIYFFVWLLFLFTNISFHQTFALLCVLSFGVLFAKFGRTSYLGWSRLERLHRLIEEERWEIEHHREQEKKELLEMYRIKGFSGNLLNEIVETLMSDNNRLLEVMLTEELGLTLQSYEHPLKQGMFAALGVLTSSVLFLLSFFLQPLIGPLVISFILISAGSLFFAKLQKNEKIRALIWELSLLILGAGSIYFLGRFIFKVSL